MQSCAVQYSTVQYSTVQYSTVQHIAVQYSIKQCSTVPAVQGRDLRPAACVATTAPNVPRQIAKSGNSIPPHVRIVFLPACEPDFFHYPSSTRPRAQTCRTWPYVGQFHHVVKRVSSRYLQCGCSPRLGLDSS